MRSVRRRPLVRAAAAVAACAAGVLALPGGAVAARAAETATAPRTLVSSRTLADGVSTAKVYRVGENAYQAEIAGGGDTVSRVSSRDGAVGYGSSGELRIALRPDGRLSSWVPTGGRSATAAYDGPAATSGPADALRLRTLADAPGDGVLLLAAGGGMAALGAAGLGFAMLRRGRTDG
ncbi:hypothetical protein [Streptomyces sp. NPDC012888]|uniref:hypothetical protein n=1 Tax=Streptomyces sp. NPDC012888 TaxID=3364855 RepID=UPI0036918C4E